MFFSMNIIEFELQTLAGVDLIRVKARRLRAELSQSLRSLRCGPLKSTAKVDVFSFALILFEIVLGLPALGRRNTSEGLEKLPVNACERIDIPGSIPEFVSVLIESRLSANPRERPSFNDIFDALKKNCFKIAGGVDSDEVSAFVSLVESSET
jgi:hypothetical protein